MMRLVNFKVPDHYRKVSIEILGGHQKATVAATSGDTPGSRKGGGNSVERAITKAGTAEENALLAGNRKVDHRDRWARIDAARLGRSIPQIGNH